MQIVPNCGHDYAGATTPNVIRGNSDVRFWGLSGHDADVLQCPLLTQSGHGRLKIVAVQLDPEPHFSGRKSLM